MIYSLLTVNINVLQLGILKLYKKTTSYIAQDNSRFVFEILYIFYKKSKNACAF